MKFLAALPLMLLPAFACAQTAATPQIMTDVQAGDFTDATALAAQTGDPLMSKLVTFFRLIAQGGGTADEINQFIAANPDWPEQRLLALRAAQAAGLPAQAAEPAPDFLTQVEALHDAGQDIQAARLWTTQGQAAFAAADSTQRLLFWPDQSRLARALLAAGDARDAYAVAAAVSPPTSGAVDQVLDQDFLAGFIALRFLHQPEQAAPWFRALAAASPAVITQARAYYWLARTETGPQAAADYARAAAYPSTFYGQLANFALGGSAQDMAARILGAQEPDFSAGDALSFGLMELPRAAVLLVQMNDTRDAVMFLNRLGQVADDDKTRVMAARLALGLGLPQSAVSIARSAGIAGQTLLHDGWPTPFTPQGALEPAVADGIMRQESSFDPNIVSGAGAVGLMQLLPGTARLTARHDGLPMGNLFDPSTNITLGSAYLAHEVDNFGNCLPLAIAAYNAGPTNVARWLKQYGDPELGSNAGGADILDWIEQIPFSETRNYVQRVLENITIYRALLTGAAPSPLDPWQTS
ncbi:lytic transglycosylase domain-containing protein [Acidocella sp. KAb 2-4]|uniref:lytic transglycosylase domain-containing protein n=1 Tax=Acidocella sp. KAb 2-4 TaxID=2885158 RepID=UPI001D061FBE|nr:lytic transglycosylase domain-containing protein [Acidocella sp. KAb 2-4]MCB5944886.1 lytic transglycosylase domain-containing protein [Acidocella sp. KAb 2-4]